MNRRDLDILCKALSEARPSVVHDGAYVGWRSAVRSVANQCSENFANFDYTKFMERCGVRS